MIGFARQLWLAIKRPMEAILGPERVDRWLDHMRFYEWKSRLVRSTMTLPDGTRVVVRPGDRRIVDEVHGGCYDRATIRAGDKVLDVGAHVGSFTVLAARRAGSLGVVVAVEPDPPNAALVAVNVRANKLANVTLVRAAVDAHPGRGFLHRSGDAAMHTLLPRYGRRVPVRITTLDAIALEAGLDHVDVVKIDVEGAELGVLAGGRAILSTAREVVMETSGEQLEAVRSALDRLGLRVDDVRATQGGLIVHGSRERSAPDSSRVGS